MAFAVSFGVDVDAGDGDGATGLQDVGLGDDAVSLGRAEKVDLVFEREDVGAGGLDGEGGIATGGIGDGADHTAVEKAILLGDGGGKGHFNDAAADGDLLQDGAQGAQEALAREAGPEFILYLVVQHISFYCCCPG